MVGMDVVGAFGYNARIAAPAGSVGTWEDGGSVQRHHTVVAVNVVIPTGGVGCAGNLFLEIFAKIVMRILYTVIKIPYGFVALLVNAVKQFNPAAERSRSIALLYFSGLIKNFFFYFLLDQKVAKSQVGGFGFAQPPNATVRPHRLPTLPPAEVFYFAHSVGDDRNLKMFVIGNHEHYDFLTWRK